MKDGVKVLKTRAAAGPPAALRFPSVPAFFFVREERGGLVSSSIAAVDLVREEAQADREWLQVLYLDPKNQLIEKRLESFGTVDSSAVYPREIMRSVLLLGAAAVIVLHNHPSGDPDPSLCDKEITRDIVAAAALFQVKVLDHIIIGAKVNGAQKYFSFADQGLIDDYGAAFHLPGARP